MNKYGFVHIHSHTEMSMLDGGAKIKDIITKVHSMGQTALATTDHGNMHVALAKTHKGYQNLCKLSSLGYTEGFYRRPRVDMDMLAQLKDDIIITSACIGGAIPQAILAGDFELANQQSNGLHRSLARTSI